MKISHLNRECCWQRYQLDIGENGRLKPAIFAAFFAFSVKLFEPAGLTQGRLMPPPPEQAVNSHWRSFEQPFSSRRITKNNFVRDRDDMPSLTLLDHLRIKQLMRRNQVRQGMASSRSLSRQPLQSSINVEQRSLVSRQLVASEEREAIVGADFRRASSVASSLCAVADDESRDHSPKRARSTRK